MNLFIGFWIRLNVQEYTITAAAANTKQLQMYTNKQMVLATTFDSGECRFFWPPLLRVVNAGLLLPLKGGESRLI